jgi:hypothetical protein
MLNAVSTCHSIQVADLTAGTVQLYFTRLLAKALDLSLNATAEPGRFRLRVVAPR